MSVVLSILSRIWHPWWSLAKHFSPKKAISGTRKFMWCPCFSSFHHPLTFSLSQYTLPPVSDSDGTWTSETSRFLLLMSMILTSMFKIQCWGYIEHRNFLFSMVRKSMFLGFHSLVRPLRYTKYENKRARSCALRIHLSLFLII